MTTLQENAQSTWEQLFKTSAQNEWRGWDPYDALSSPWIRALSLGVKPLRIAWIQLIKRSPINLRPWLGVPKLENPKALALFASAALTEADAVKKEMGKNLLERLLLLRISSAPGSAWGYPFPWQSRAFYAPPNTPNVIVTSFAAHAFLDGYDQFSDARYLQAALGACRFIREGLHRFVLEDAICFSYTPLDRSRIHNANLLAAALLCRAGSTSRDSSLVQEGLQACRYSVHAQKPDGSWVYGEAANQRWVDHFHTGYNLIALDTIVRSTSDQSALAALEKGFKFYLGHFFLEGGTPRYYADKAWPIDIHSAAVAIDTLSKLSGRFPGASPLAEKVLCWTLANMQDPQTKHFYFQKTRYWTNKTPFLRWSDAWMTKALGSYLSYSRTRIRDVAYAAS